LLLSVAPSIQVLKGARQPQQIEKRKKIFPSELLQTPNQYERT